MIGPAGGEHETARRTPSCRLEDYTRWVHLVAAMLRGGFTPEGGGQDRRRQLPAHLPRCSRLKVCDTNPIVALPLAAHRGGFSGSWGDPLPVSSDAARSHPMPSEPPCFRGARHPIGTLAVTKLWSAIRRWNAGKRLGLLLRGSHVVLESWRETGA